MTDNIPLDELTKALSQMVGLERAREMIKDAVAAAGLTPKPAYAREEIRAICNHLKSQGGMIGVVVSAVAVRLLTS